MVLATKLLCRLIHLPLCFRYLRAQIVVQHRREPRIVQHGCVQVVQQLPDGERPCGIAFRPAGAVQVQQSQRGFIRAGQDLCHFLRRKGGFGNHRVGHAAHLLEGGHRRLVEHGRGGRTAQRVVRQKNDEIVHGQRTLRRVLCPEAHFQQLRDLRFVHACRSSQHRRSKGRCNRLFVRQRQQAGKLCAHFFVYISGQLRICQAVLRKAGKLRKR